MGTFVLAYEDADSPTEIASWTNEKIGNEIGNGFIAENVVSISMTEDIGHYSDSRHRFNAIVVFSVRSAA